MVDIFKVWFIVLPIKSIMKIEIINQIGDYKSIYENREQIFKNTLFYKKILAINLNNDKIRKIEGSLESGEYSLTVYTDKEYPNNFKLIDEPPFCIFYKGDLKRVNELKFLAVVGSRKNTSYGEIITKEIVSSLKGQEGVALVSGGAIGIDSIAHKTAIESEVYNVAILGCGIDIVYPKSNIDVFLKIINNGVLMTEFLPGESPMYYNFPRRNRLISALSTAVIVSEAGARSGATNTAYHANSQNKSVYAVPGNINSEYSKGCNLLINDGALVYLNIENVFKDIGVDYKNEKKDKNYEIKLNILSILGDEPVHFDKIINQIKVDRNIINELLFEMQFNNEIVGLMGNNYIKILRNN